MTREPDDAKETLRRYLLTGFATLRWKLEGLPEHELRRPLVATGTNLLGIAKHVAIVCGEYFGLVFGRPTALPPLPEDEPNADMWATEDESSEYVVGLLDIAAAEAAATIDALELDSPGHVPWWGPERADVTLHTILVHTLAELNRHAGHADIVRELIDGEVGLRQDNSNLPGGDEGYSVQWWADYRARLQAVADSFR